MVAKWLNTEYWLVSFVVLQGIRTNIAGKPYGFFFHFSWGVRTPCPPPDPRMKGVSILIRVKRHLSKSVYFPQMGTFFLSPQIHQICRSPMTRPLILVFMYLLK